MHSQRHVILRQTLELSIARSGDAWPLQQQVSGIMRKLEAVIERRCNELSSSDRLHRIDCLELDLGLLDSSRLEEEIIEKFDQVLRHGLAEQVRQQETAAVPPKTASQLELFAQFVRQGSLPWWADLAQTGQPQKSLDLLLREAPDLLSRLLPELVVDPNALRRLIVHFDDRQLAGLIVLLAPALADFPRQLFEALLCMPACFPTLATASPVQFRNHIWQGILSSLGLSGERPANPMDFSRDVLMRLARLQAAATDLPEDLQEMAAALAAKSGLLSDSELLKLKLKVDNLDEVVHHPQWGGETGEAALESLRLWLEQDIQEAIPSWLQSWPEALRLALSARLNELKPDIQTALAELRSWLEQDSQSTMPAWLQSWPMLLREEFFAQLWELGKRPEAVPIPAQIVRHERLNPLPAAAEQKHWEQVLKQAEFSETDAIYLSNSGLVILWPFLKPFFGRLGLLEENRFRDEAARQRGVALLQCLASGDASSPEHLLPLNKLLCGMELEAVFELEQPLTEEEIADGEGLLEALIAQAPILNNMSVSGFRSSFLLRTGILQVRDGAWLLRVERETYDLVLDRFPWGFSWVKLPWMEIPLQVEW
jgi:hypothetical protein